MGQERFILGYIQGLIENLQIHQGHIPYLFPEETTRNITFTCGGGVDTFGAWTEIVDSGAVTFSSKFASHPGTFDEVMLFAYSVPNIIYIVEIAYGVAKTIVERVRVYSDWTYKLRVDSNEIPAGEIVYYRAKAQNALATLRVGFKYYYTD